MSYIFISYSKGNITFARHLRSLLRAEGFSVWMDETRSESSNRWWYTIEANMIGAAAIILIVSPESKRSERVQNEMELARLNKKPIFPLLLGGNRWARFEESEYVDMTAGLYASLPAHFVRSLKDFVPVNSAEPVPPPIPGERISTDEITLIPRRTHRTRRVWLVLLVVVWVVFGAVAFLLVDRGLIGNGDDAEEDHTATPVLVAQNIEMTIDAEMALILTETQLTESAVAGEPDVRALAYARLTATQSIVNLTMTAEDFTETPTITRTPRPSATTDTRPAEMTLSAAQQAVASATQLIADLTATAERYTATPTATDTPTVTRTPRPSRTPVPTENQTAVAAQDALATALKLLDDLTATATAERTPEDGVTAGWTEGTVLYIQDETGPSGVAGREPAPNRATQYQPGDTVTLGVAPVAPDVEREWYIVPQTGERWWFIGDRGGGWVPERVLGSTPPGL